MRYLRFDDIDGFREHAEPFLVTREAEHGLLVSVIASWDRIAADAHAGLLMDDDGSVADALRNEACGAVLGAKDTVEAVATAQQRTITRQLAQGIYENRGVVWPIAHPAGRRRVADAGGEDTLIAFHVALSEAIGHRESTDAARASVAARIAAGALHVWEDDGHIVSSAAAVGPTPHGIRINLVYTPPERRGRGYAGYLVAELTQELLDAGRTFVFLHTDLANPTSNALYRRVGYERVFDFLMLALAPAGSGPAL